MFEQEITQVVLRLFVDKKRTMDVDSIIEELPYTKVEVLKSLSLLSGLGLLNKVSSKEGSKPINLYSVVTEVKALHLATAAQMGLDLNSFEKDFKINKKEKQMALELSTKVEKIKVLDAKSHKPLVSKNRHYLSVEDEDEILENLFLIFEATNMSLYEYLESKCKKDEYLSALMLLHAQSEEALKIYSEQLKK